MGGRVVQAHPAAVVHPDAGDEIGGGQEGIEVAAATFEVFAQQPLGEGIAAGMLPGRIRRRITAVGLFIGAVERDLVVAGGIRPGVLPVVGDGGILTVSRRDGLVAVARSGHRAPATGRQQAGKAQEKKNQSSHAVLLQLWPMILHVVRKRRRSQAGDRGRDLPPRTGFPPLSGV